MSSLQRQTVGRLVDSMGSISLTGPGTDGACVCMRVCVAGGGGGGGGGGGVTGSDGGYTA